ncbi:amidohydrolase family protein [Christiangramia crocea]|uniref:Amidohydrolase family protein n=1 Tax=Christiangramia crocea TaxID=2904124 RepID=A0A9X1V299_9FLAO|nr:amidohydrolase family protein [Gramella crocea]MCG9973273.1 amidohydrolase family protein [Gramella crocea]
MKKYIPLLMSLLFSIGIYPQEQPLPVIDMHLHAIPVDMNGPPPVAICAPPTEMPVWDQSKPWGETFVGLAKQPNCENAIWSPETNEELLKQTLERMEENNVYGVTSGPFLDQYLNRENKRTIPSLFFEIKEGVTPENIKRELASGKYRVLGEVVIQYNGISPGDSIFEPYASIAEELDIPMGIHMGPGPPGASYLPPFKNYRAQLDSPLLIEDLLIKHPDLRVYIMHAGWPMIDDMIALLYSHPQVYVGIGVINYAIPRKEFYRYLQRIVEAGFAKRIMFGSDQMVWPDAIKRGIDAIENADFLTEVQKRDILYNNAARFLRLNEDEMKNHFEGTALQVDD